MQEAVCLPLRKLSGWLSTISPNKVKAELRETIIQYQNECDDVLWAHWSKEHDKQYPTPSLANPTKILLVIENGITQQVIVPPGSCIIDTDSKASITTILNEYIPHELLPFVIDLANQRMSDYVDYLKSKISIQA